MTLDDETASRIANEVWAKRSKRHTVGGEEYVRAGWDARDAEVEELRARLARVREWAESVALHPDPPADDEMAGQINAAGDVLAILDESPTERETPADAVATVVAAWRGVGKGPKIPALSNLAAALDRLAEAYGEVVPDDRA